MGTGRDERPGQERRQGGREGPQHRGHFPPVLHFPNIYSFGLFIFVGFGIRNVSASPNDLVPSQARTRRGVPISLTIWLPSAAVTSRTGKFGVEQAPTSCPLLGSQPAYTEHAF